MKKLKLLARNQGIPKYYNMLKSELIKALEPPQVPKPNILDESVPEINIPILKPSNPTKKSHITSLKLQESRANNEVRKEIINFSDLMYQNQYKRL